MKTVWVTREIDAPADVLWSLFIDLERWPEWGPSVRRAELHGDVFEVGATGTVTTPVGATLGFEIVECVDGASWAWKVAGLPATAHSVESLDPGRCRIGFGVPWFAAPYLAVCEVALRRMESLAALEPVGLR